MPPGCKIALARAASTLVSPRGTTEKPKNWGHPTLSQGAPITSRNAIPFAAAWTEQGVPSFSPCGAGGSACVLSSPEPLHA
jgi:fructose-specific phosphotransferase system IIC component